MRVLVHQAKSWTFTSCVCRRCCVRQSTAAVSEICFHVQCLPVFGANADASGCVNCDTVGPGVEEWVFLNANRQCSGPLPLPVLQTLDPPLFGSTSLSKTFYMEANVAGKYAPLATPRVP
jgi:hypothetical protein